VVFVRRNKVNLEIRAKEESWVRITGDGRLLMEGILSPSASRQFIKLFQDGCNRHRVDGNELTEMCGSVVPPDRVVYIGADIQRRGLLAGRPPVDWMEAVTENYLAPGGRPVAALEKVRSEVPVALHGVSLSIGSTDPLDRTYLTALRALVDRIEPAIVSDHLCWGRHGGRYVHDLWPLPLTEEALAHVVERVGEMQEALGRQILLENVSSYVAFRESTISEWEFIGEVARRADCGILLDVNNIYVSARNHGFSAAGYIAGVPADRIAQFLAMARRRFRLGLCTLSSSSVSYCFAGRGAD